MAFCQQCGGEVLETAVVCVKCGSAIKKETAVQTTTEGTEAWSKNKMWAYGIASFIIPIIGIILGIIGMTKESRRLQGVILLGIALFGAGFWKGFFS